MSAAFPVWSVLAYLNVEGGSWLDLTPDVMGLSMDWGLSGNGPFDLMAETGELKFTLKNLNNYYTPGHASCINGWQKNMIVKLVAAWEGQTYIRFRGTIEDLDIIPGYARSFILVTVLDWMNYAAKQPFSLPALGTNQRADEALWTILTAMPIQPLATDFDTGKETFKTVFDTVTARTTAYAEMAKLANSEGGYIYLRHDGDYGETLVFENNEARNGLDTLTPIPIGADVAGHLLKEDGGALLTEAGGFILLDAPTTFTADAELKGAGVVYGKHTINLVKITAHPKTVAVAAEVLYAIGSPLAIAPSETKTVKGLYRDPTGGKKVNGYAMITPVATTDYQMWTNSNGTGTNNTAALIIAATYGTEGVKYLLTNPTASLCYITKLQARGYKITNNDQLEYTAESEDSQDDYGYQEKTLSQLYQQELLNGTRLADQVLLLEKNPRSVLNSVTLNANRDGSCMNAALNLDVGDLIAVTHAQTAISGYYYIQHVTITISKGGIVMITWLLRQAFLLLTGLTLIVVEFGATYPPAGGVADRILFGALPQIENLDNFTVAAWIYPHTPGAPYAGVMYRIGGNWSGERGWIIYVDPTNLNLQFMQEPGVDADDAGVWRTADATITLNAWNHVAITRDISPYTNAPLLYIDGVSMAVTTVTPQESITGSDAGLLLFLGNQGFVVAPDPYYLPFDGLIKDFRIYNTILSTADILAMKNGTLATTSACVFKGPYVYTRDLAHYTDLTLTDKDHLLDAIFGEVGKPLGAPITRIP